MTRSGGGSPVEARELEALLTLLATPRLGQHSVLALLRAHGSTHGSAQNALHALHALAAECGADIAAAARRPTVRRRVERALSTIEAERIHTIPFGTPAYPRVLFERLNAAAPPVLFARGELAALDRIGVAVVGCRAATEYGLDVAHTIGAAVARAGGCVISGLARGIDAAAHTAALDAGGATIAVLGCGVDVYYPQQNMRLQDRIAAGGLLLSEFLPGEGPRSYMFPHRNRIIAALSRAVVVVEAGEKSGAILTADHSVSMDVETFAVPGAIDRPNTQGILGLYRDGVPPFTGVRDLLDSVGLTSIGARLPEAPAAPPLDGQHARVWNALAAEPMHVDGIAMSAGLSAGAALGVLLELELDGRVQQLPGGRFGPAPSARRMRISASR